MVLVFNSIANITSVEIKPYSSNQSNQLEVDYRDYEEFVIKWINSSEKHFDFMNEVHIRESLSGKNNAFSDDHLYITPNGKYGVLEFDENENEYFSEFEHYGDYHLWTAKEYGRVSENSFCKQCEFKGRCLTEHYKEVKNLDRSCNGYYNLLKSYEKTVLNN